MIRLIFIFLFAVGTLAAHADDTPPDENQGIAPELQAHNPDAQVESANCASPVPIKSVFIDRCLSRCPASRETCSLMFDLNAMAANCSGTYSQADACQNKTAAVPLPKARPKSADATPKKQAKSAGKPSEGDSGDGTDKPDDSADFVNCTAAAQQASNCCNNPSSCQGGVANAFSLGSDGGGISQAFQQAGAAGQQAANVGYKAAQICYQSIRSCNDTCTAGAKKKGSSADAMTASANSCNGLSGMMRQLATNAQNNFQAQSLGQNGANLASAMPQSLDNSAYNPNNPYQQNAAATAAAAAAMQAQKGGDGFQAGAQAAKNGFDTGNLGDKVNPQTQFAIPNNGAVDPNQMANMMNQNNVAPIQSGGGSSGGLPGSDTAGSQKAKLPPPSGGYYGGKSLAGEIDANALRGGGGYTPPSAGGPSGVQVASGPAVDPRDPASEGGIDLRQYLPGGRRDGTRTGGYHTTSNEIAGQFTDLWKKISLRMQEKCRLGILLGCEHGM